MRNSSVPAAVLSAAPRDPLYAGRRGVAGRRQAHAGVDGRKLSIRSSGCAISQSASAHKSTTSSPTRHTRVRPGPDFNRREPFPMLHQGPA